MFNRLIVLAMLLASTICLTGNAEAAREPGNGGGRPEEFHNSVFTPSPKNQVEWLIYWYICGTDLETKWNEVSSDISEMEQVQFPPNIKILIQTGTTSKWHHDFINANGRYRYDNNGFNVISKFNSKMYEPETLKNFLEYGENLYNPNHRILIFWDHGGVGGICMDVEGTEKSLSLNNLRSALEKVYGKSPRKIPFEIIGFDACLMGSYECANNVDGFANYMVASEAKENSFGWYYTDWLTFLAEHPESNGAILGEKICSTSLEDCMRHKVASDSTFSTIDMSKLDNVRNAHQRFFSEAFNRSKSSNNFSIRFSRTALNSSRSFGETYIDLKLLAESTRDLMTNDISDALIAAIDDAIVGEPSNGNVYKGSGGLSTYYPYNGNGYSEYKEQNCALQEQKDFYDMLLGMSGNATNEQENSNNLRGQRSASSKTLPLMDVPVSVDENKHLVVQLTPEQLDLVSSVRCMVLPSIELANSELGVKDKAIVVLGNDVDFTGDWQTGTFHDNFRNVWASIDGHLIHMAVTFSNAEYNIYEVPIKLNGEFRILEMTYSYVDKKYSLLGARERMKRGIASKDVKFLNEGDEVTPLFLIYAPSDSLDAEDKSEDSFKVTEGTPFIISGEPIIEDKNLGNGEYGYCFQFFGPGETSLGLSQRAVFEIENGEIVDTWLIEKNKETKDKEIKDEETKDEEIKDKETRDEEIKDKETKDEVSRES